MGASGQSASPLTSLPEFYLQRGLLYHLHIDLLHRCPQRCFHCYLGPRVRSHERLATETVLRLLGEAASMGAMLLTLSGGEPLLHPGLPDILMAAQRLRFRTRLKTSGILLDEKFADLLADLPLVHVDISLHGATADAHDKATGVPGSFEKAMSAVRRLLARGVSVKVAATFPPWALGQLEEFEATMRDLGVEYSIGVAFLPVVYGGCQEVEHGRAADCASFLRSRSAAPRGPDLSQPLCVGVQLGLYISPKGEIQPCCVWPQVIGTVESPLKDAFESKARLILAGGAHADRSECLDCELWRYCVFCPAVSVACGAGPTGKNRWACQMAEWRRRIWGVPDVANRG